MSQLPPEAQVSRNVCTLPLELIFHILDQLVASRDGHHPIAYAPSDAITKTLRALTLVSYSFHRIASKYLYIHCVYLNRRTSYACFRRTLGLNLGNRPQALEYGQAGRNERLFADADLTRHVTSIFISPMGMITNTTTPQVCLPQLIDLGNTIGRTLKRMALDFSDIYATPSKVVLVKPQITENNIFLRMPNLEELIISYEVVDYFPFPPPNLKRLAITVQDMSDTPLQFCFSISSLQILIFLRPLELTSTAIDLWFSSYLGRSLDIVLVDVNSNHKTPRMTRSWEDDDTLRVWEADVPTSFYGDEDDLNLCDSWIWTHGVKGTIWTQDKRRMASWAEIERRLAGSVHTIVNGSSS